MGYTNEISTTTYYDSKNGHEVSAERAKELNTNYYGGENHRAFPKNDTTVNLKLALASGLSTTSIVGILFMIPILVRRKNE